MNKSLQELTMKDNFMFAAVMLEAENCKQLLERILNIPIDRVEVDYEKSIVYHPEYKGIRLDVYAKDEEGRHFNVEMQVVKQDVAKRARYYHSQIDTKLIATGIEYEKLPECYVIFICDFDPFGMEKYCYTVRHTFWEDDSYVYRDGNDTIFLSTKGKNPKEVSATLVHFLKYVGSGLEESECDFEDAYVTGLQNSVRKIKQDREMGARYMLMHELMKDEYKAGKADGISQGMSTMLLMCLTRLGIVSKELSDTITVVKDASKYEQLLQIALESKSIEEFLEKSNL